MQDFDNNTKIILGEARPSRRCWTIKLRKPLSKESYGTKLDGEFNLGLPQPCFKNLDHS